MEAQDALVGIVGLGTIGSAVADHVLASGRPMVGWARRRDSLETFASRGGLARRLGGGRGGGLDRF